MDGPNEHAPDDTPGDPTDELTALREQLVAARTEVERLRAGAASAAGASAEAAVLREQLQQAAVRYREAVLRGEPSLPPELVAGDSIEAVEQSAGAARAMIARVREQVEAEHRGARVPPGAPARSAPDVSGMSAREMIRYGLSLRERA